MRLCIKSRGYLSTQHIYNQTDDFPYLWFVTMITWPLLYSLLYQIILTSAMWFNHIAGVITLSHAHAVIDSTTLLWSDSMFYVLPYSILYKMNSVNHALITWCLWSSQSECRITQLGLHWNHALITWCLWSGQSECRITQLGLHWSNLDWAPSGYGWIMAQGQFRS